MVAVLRLKNRILLAVEMLLCTFAVLACMRMRFYELSITEMLTQSEFTLRASLYVAIFSLSIFLNDLFHIQVLVDKRSFLTRLAQTTLVSIAFYALLTAVLGERAQGRGVFLLSLLLIQVLMVGLYKFIDRFSDTRLFLNRVLVLGDSRIAEVLRQELRSGRYRQSLVDDERLEFQIIENIVRLGRGDTRTLADFVQLEEYADLLVIALESEAITMDREKGLSATSASTPRWSGRVLKLNRSESAQTNRVSVAEKLIEDSADAFIKGLIALKIRRVPMALGLDYHQELTGRIFLGSPHDPTFFLQTHFNIDKMSFLVKSVWEWILGAIILIFALPFMAIVPIFIWLDTGRPVLFIQPRVGRGGKVLNLYKFRSMTVDGKVTRIGRIIRATKLDELPQLINVLRGEMSLVGPRPELPQFVENFKEMAAHYELRHMVRPGLTGWAQVMFPDAKAEHALIKLSYDLYYVKHFSLISDVVIMMETFKMIVFGGLRRIGKFAHRSEVAEQKKQPEDTRARSVQSA